jgi:adenosine deaminase
MLTSEILRKAPKALLHDHLDGGLRVKTILELAREVDYQKLPFENEAELTNWFHTAVQGSLEIYLETFAHTVAVMQTPAAISRVARECVEDLAVDGVIYAEVRFAPELHTANGLSYEEVIDAVLAGFREGEESAKKLGHQIRIGALLTAMRMADVSLEIAKLVVKYRNQGVVGFDIAGKEKGYPPTEHIDAFQYLQRENAHFTIHAGEGFGLKSIWEAIQFCGAERLGHGVRIIDDIKINSDGSVTLGDLAAYVRDRRIPLELCPKSNVDTGAAESIAKHPIGLLRKLNFRVTLNTDNRLMSDTSMTKEMMSLVEAFDYTLKDFEWLTINSLKSSFIPFDERLNLINNVVKPGYAKLREKFDLQ